jgi:MOSC domain-containing protein YiiM
MKKINILKLYTSDINSKERIEKNEICLDTFGIKGDKFYKKDINRSVLITSTDAYKIALENNVNINYGILGENILIDYDISTFKIGDRIMIDACELEISQNCTICNHLNLIHNNLATILKDDRGIFAKVIKGGNINIENTISIL